MTATRRGLLAAGGVLAVGGLSGCLQQLADRTTNTSASPAAFYGGGGTSTDSGRLYAPGPTTVRYVPASIRGGAAFLSGAIDFDGWSTASTTQAQDYNSSRSNKPSTVWWNDPDSDGDGILTAEEAFAYLDDEPTIGEQFCVCLPDAQLPGDGGALADELTPRRLVDYLLGEKEVERCEGPRSRDGIVHRDIACQNLLSATLNEPYKKKRSVVSRSTGNTVTVTVVNDPPETSDRGQAMIFGWGDTSREPTATLDDWGDELTVGEASVTATLVCPAVATPVDCPSPLPAVFYARRVRHDDQYLYVGGWLLDEGALYDDSATVCIVDEVTDVVGVRLDDLDGDGYGDLVASRFSGSHSQYGSTVFSGAYDPQRVAFFGESLASAARNGGAAHWQQLTGRSTSEDGETRCICAHLSAPLVHLVDAADSSNEVKFKAGAELSKAVN